MADPRAARRPITPIRLSSLPDSPPPDSLNSPGPGPAGGGEDKMLCDRCGAEVYRMHAVWRCPVCGFKSDCCGW
jgi:hypothetical protein